MASDPAELSDEEIDRLAAEAIARMEPQVEEIFKGLARAFQDHVDAITAFAKIPEMLAREVVAELDSIAAP